MNKTPKKAAPGGDERNLNNRRLKATTAASKASETSSHKRQRESESSNRPLLNPVQKGIPDQRKNFKSKLRVPAKVETGKNLKLVGKPTASTREKKLALAIKSAQTKFANMQPESEESEIKSNVTVQEEKPTEQSSNDKQDLVEEHVDHASSEQTSVSQEQTDAAEKEAESKEEKNGDQCLDTANESTENKEVEENEENDIMLSFDTDETPEKNHKNNVDGKDSKDESKEEYHSIVIDSKTVTEAKEDAQESQTDVENNSEDVLESTASELSEASEATSQTDSQKEGKRSEEPASRDVSFVTYDPSIMLKDVQIKLNDCLKENSKLFETSNAESTSTPFQTPKDASFGKTLRSITGRRSLSRMRHVTLREQRYSPNNSMFVNTSSASLPVDDAADFKILSYTTGPADTVSTVNGNPLEKKRKHEVEEWNSSKKQKADTENNLLNTSISLLKGLRRPIQVSTPVSDLKFQSDKLDLSEDEAAPINEGSRKWCVIM